MRDFKTYIKEQEIMALRNALMNFFSGNPDPSDKEVHAFAEELGINEHSLEEVIYGIMSDFFSGGLWNEKGRPQLDERELEMGIEVEMEHTKCPMIAERIARDHLSEITDYYTRLAQMEDEAKEHYGDEDE